MHGSGVSVCVMIEVCLRIPSGEGLDGGGGCGGSGGVVLLGEGHLAIRAVASGTAGAAVRACWFNGLLIDVTYNICSEMCMYVLDIMLVLFVD